jgi:hypothetical protein
MSSYADIADEAQIDGIYCSILRHILTISPSN